MGLLRPIGKEGGVEDQRLRGLEADVGQVAEVAFSVSREDGGLGVVEGPEGLWKLL